MHAVLFIRASAGPSRSHFGAMYWQPGALEYQSPLHEKTGTILGPSGSHLGAMFCHLYVCIHFVGAILEPSYMIFCACV